MEFLADIPELGFYLLTFNYIALICYAIYRVFNPEEWFEKSEASIAIVYVLGIFLFALPMFVDRILQDGGLFYMVSITICLIVIALLIKREIDQFGPKFLIPLLLFILAIGQESFYAASLDPDAPGKLVAWFLWGSMAIPLALGIIGLLFVKLFPSIASRHINLIQRPSYFALVILFFSLWMLGRHLAPVFS